MSVVIKPEAAGDTCAIREVNRAAFGGSAEADLVDRLRADGDLLLSLVAEKAGRIVGHCGFSRLTIHGGSEAAQAVSLAPVSVLPAEQRHGLGQGMIRNGIARLGAAGEALILVLGNPQYYARFGFDAFAATAYRTPYDGPHMQVLCLSDDAPVRGEVRYAPAFASL